MKHKEKVELLTTVLEQQSESGQTKGFRRWIEAWIKTNVPQCRLVTNNGNLYVTKGSASPYYPCMVSHIDTVHDINHFASVHQQGEHLFAWCEKTKKQYGIGGDDKVGVFICLAALVELPNIKCAFFRDEEIGCVGSSKAMNSWFDNCAFVLQCDRRGNKDFINDINGMDMYSKEFATAIAPALADYGYKETDGMMTDVEQLKKNKINLCMANMSCGYYEPHSNGEYVNIPDVFVCLSMCLTICREQAGQQWHHVGTYTSYAGYYGGGYSKGSYEKEWDAYWSYDKDTKTWREKGKKITRWKPADVQWDKEGMVWYLPEIVGLELKDSMITGTGKFVEPYRLKSKDVEWELEKQYPNVLTIGDVSTVDPVGKKDGIGFHITGKPRCPKCQQVDSYHDEYAGEYFCLTCGLYHHEAQKLVDRKRVTDELKQQSITFPPVNKPAKSQAELDMKAELDSTRIIRMTSDLLTKMGDSKTGTDELK